MFEMLGTLFFVVGVDNNRKHLWFTHRKPYPPSKLHKLFCPIKLCKSV